MATHVPAVLTRLVKHSVDRIRASVLLLACFPVSLTEWVRGWKTISKQGVNALLQFTNILTAFGYWQLFHLKVCVFYGLLSAYELTQSSCLTQVYGLHFPSNVVYRKPQTFPKPPPHFGLVECDLFSFLLVIVWVLELQLVSLFSYFQEKNMQNGLIII